MSLSDDEKMDYDQEDDEQELTHQPGEPSEGDDQEEQEITHVHQPNKGRYSEEVQIDTSTKGRESRQSRNRNQNMDDSADEGNEQQEDEEYQQDGQEAAEEDEEYDNQMQDDEDEDRIALSSKVKSESPQKGAGQQQQQRKLNRNNNQLIKQNQSSPAPSPPKALSKQLKNKLTMENTNYRNGRQDFNQTQDQDQENFFKCEIKDIQSFKWCLDSVKFPIGPKKNNDVIFQAMVNGISLRSSSLQGSIMTRCMLKKSFFGDNFYQVEARSNRDRHKDFSDRVHQKTPLVEFCLPFQELKSIIDGMIEDEGVVQIEYPVGDSFLQVSIPEDVRGEDCKFQSVTTIQLETFAASHNLRNESHASSDQLQAQVYGKIYHFKKVLKEFAFLGEKDRVEFRFQEAYPQVSLVYENQRTRRSHVIKFNQKIDDFVVKKASGSANYTMEALRLAFSRINNDNLVCIVSLLEDNHLSVKHMDDKMFFMIESTLLPMEMEDEDEEMNE